MKVDLAAFHGKSLSRAQAQEIVNHLIEGDSTPEQVSAFLLALKAKVETTEELLGFIDGLFKHTLFSRADFKKKLGENELIDVCGTGGDRLGTFNVSTTVALVLASHGVWVAKHGNRGVSSKSGSTDVLEALGLKSDQSTEQVATSLEKWGISFMFAPAFYPVLAKLASVRKALGTHTIFNALGPVLNPAPLTRQMIGVYDSELVLKMAAVLSERGMKEAFVIHGFDGLDELTVTGPSMIAHLRDGKITSFNIRPEDFGLNKAPIEAVRGGTPQENSQIIINILKGERSPKRDLVLLNAAAALVLAGVEKDFKAAAQLAGQIIDSGKAFEHYERIRFA